MWEYFFLPYEIFFVLLHLLSRAKAVSKKSIAILSFLLKFAKIQKEDGAFMLSLGCVCYTHSISSGVRYVPLDPVSSKVFGDTSIKTDMST